MRYAFATMFALLIVGLAGTVPDDLSTTPERQPAVPDPAECQVTPASMDRLHEVATTPLVRSSSTRSAVRADMSQVLLATDDTAAAVRATLREVVACVNAGDDLRLMALFTGDGIRRAFGTEGSPHDWDPEFTFLAQPTTPRRVADRLALIWIGEPHVLADERIGVPVISRFRDQAEEDRLFVLVQQGSGYLVDYVFDPSLRTPAPTHVPE